MKIKILKVGKVRLQPIPECRIGLEKNLNNRGSREKFYTFLQPMSDIGPKQLRISKYLKYP